MQDLLTSLAALPWEPAAVALAGAYLLLAMRENRLCWYAAFASTAIYTVLFWDAALLMESALNVYYMAMAVYGWYVWRFGGSAHQGVSIHTWRGRHHLLALAGIAGATAVSGSLLAAHTQAALPYLDSFTTWSSVFTTYLVARKVLESWLYWIVIDSASIYLYLERGLELTALLFAAYAVLAVMGWFAWRRQWLNHRATAASPA
jgi:nicotinamide mononucleotide transporter